MNKPILTPNPVAGWNCRLSCDAVLARFWGKTPREAYIALLQNGVTCSLDRAEARAILDRMGVPRRLYDVP